jgi:hypothetical protein
MSGFTAGHYEFSASTAFVLRSLFDQPIPKGGNARRQAFGCR